MKGVLYKRAKYGKVTEVGLKSLQRGQTPFIPYMNTHYQKGNYNLQFSPQDYDSLNGLERKRLAFQDAKNHLKFYQKLIRKGFYPEGTNVKIKYSEGKFALQFWMPKVKVLSRWIRDRDLRKGFVRQNENRSSGYDCRELYDEMARMANDLIGQVQHALGKLDIKDEKEFNPDFYFPRNYGLDAKGNVRYLDLHILWEKLPFAKRKNGQRLAKSSIKNSLEGKVTSIIAISGLTLSLLFFSSSITGNVIGNITNSTSNILGAVFLLVGIVGSFFYFRNREKDRKI